VENKTPPQYVQTGISACSSSLGTVTVTWLAEQSPPTFLVSGHEDAYKTSGLYIHQRKDKLSNPTITGFVASGSTATVAWSLSY
jgi:hypothetical protein